MGEVKKNHVVVGIVVQVKEEQRERGRQHAAQADRRQSDDLENEHVI